MLTWAHYRFELFLKHKAAEYNKIVLDVSEAYTSKTVSWTGEILNNLGSQKIVTGIGWFPPRSRSGTDVLSRLKWSAWNFDHASW
ncbi:zinc ribbon domain-containing protein [Dapis sp. BLCC M172]|uniref:zinc ribbon domain-containing protein n=1 Tax=Dapis sp. BLCC M172 TaxID=2975281 RepID=UPI003CF3A2D6